MEKAYNISKTTRKTDLVSPKSTVMNEKSTAISAEKSKNHRLELDGHQLISVWGVKGVPTFGEKEIIIQLDGENLLISGHNLEIKLLDLEKGQLIAKGYVTALRYSSSLEKGVLKKIFK